MEKESERKVSRRQDVEVQTEDGKTGNCSDNAFIPFLQIFRAGRHMDDQGRPRTALATVHILPMFLRGLHAEQEYHIIC